MRELISGYFVDKARSARVLEKLGFAVTGRSRQSCVAQGKDLPHVDMALTSEAWAARRKGDASP
jgi:RimJ/RimL family protein N-acetyltransferase